MKIIVEYDPSTGMVTMGDKPYFTVMFEKDIQEYEEKDDQIVKLASLGYTADELIKMKTTGII